jgi:hypothetical protein
LLIAGRIENFIFVIKNYGTMCYIIGRKRYKLLYAERRRGYGYKNGKCLVEAGK